jgi:hypothetical protein
METREGTAAASHQESTQELELGRRVVHELVVENHPLEPRFARRQAIGERFLLARQRRLFPAA